MSLFAENPTPEVSEGAAASAENSLPGLPKIEVDAQVAVRAGPSGEVAPAVGNPSNSLVEDVESSPPKVEVDAQIAAQGVCEGAVESAVDSLPRPPNPPVVRRKSFKSKRKRKKNIYSKLRRICDAVRQGCREIVKFGKKFSKNFFT